MEKHCDICGDVGDIDSLVTCARCKSSSEHLYCMHTSHKHHPEGWYCEECEDIIKASSSNSPGKFQYDSARPNELPNDLRNSMDLEKIQTGKVRPPSPQEIMMLTSEAQVFGFPSTIPRRRRSILDRTPMMTGGILPVANSQLVTRNLSSEPPIARQQVTVSVGGLRAPEKDAIQFPPKKRILREYIQKGQPMDAIEDSADIRRPQIRVKKAAKASGTVSPLRDGQPIVISGVSVSPNLEIQLADSMRVVPSSSLPMDDNCLCIPASDATWKGSFIVLLNGPRQWEISGDIQAHLPSRVRRKVYESSKLMPEVLEFELVQRGSLWISLFENYHPDRRDIGLYLFPSDPERCKNYMALLKRMEEQDLVLRNFMGGRELFIFTSKMLLTDYQRWNGNHFLWGVFCCSKLASTSIPEGNNTEVVNMEIDTISGGNFERSDAANLPPPNIKEEPCC